MYKTIWFIRRNPSLTREEFIDYYETKHSKFVKDLPGCRRYFRRYPIQVSNLADEADQGTLTFDVVMELWFDSKEAADAAFQNVADTVWPEVVEDEKHIFDRSSQGWCTTAIIDVEHESDLSSPTFETTYQRGTTAAIGE